MHPQYISIPLCNRYGITVGVTLIDLADVPVVASYRWGRHSQGYACAWDRNTKRPLLLHRIVLGLEGAGRAVEVDHRNGLVLDNRRANLRVVTHAQNLQNRQGDGPYRGVRWSACAGRWLAGAVLNKQFHYLGLFTDREEAARVVRAWRAEHMPYSVEHGL